MCFHWIKEYNILNWIIIKIIESKNIEPTILENCQHETIQNLHNDVTKLKILDHTFSKQKVQIPGYWRTSHHTALVPLL